MSSYVRKVGVRWDANRIGSVAMQRAVLVCCSLVFVVFLVACGGGQQAGPAATSRDSSSPPGASSPSESAAQRYAKRIEELRASKTSKCEQEVSTAEAKVASLKSDLADTKKRHKAAIAAVIMAKKDNEFKQHIANLTKELAAAEAKVEKAKTELRSVANWEPRIDPQEMRPGDLGRLGVGEEHVPTFRVLQIVDASNMLVTYSESIYWITGLSTARLADGGTITVPGIIECTGNRQYRTTIGATKTVFVIKALAD